MANGCTRSVLYTWGSVHTVCSILNELWERRAIHCRAKGIKELEKTVGRIADGKQAEFVKFSSVTDPVRRNNLVFNRKRCVIKKKSRILQRLKNMQMCFSVLTSLVLLTSWETFTRCFQTSSKTSLRVIKLLVPLRSGYEEQGNGVAAQHSWQSERPHHFYMWHSPIAIEESMAGVVCCGSLVQFLKWSLNKCYTDLQEGELGGKDSSSRSVYVGQVQRRARHCRQHRKLSSF